jgi:hypothetical protein
MGKMKSGTTSIYGYFKCGLDPKMAKLSHYDCNHKKNTPQEKIGKTSSLNHGCDMITPDFEGKSFNTR